LYDYDDDGGDDDDDDDDGFSLKAGAFTPPGDEMSEVVSRCLPHRQLWVATQ